MVVGAPSDFGYSFDPTPIKGKVSWTICSTQQLLEVTIDRFFTRVCVSVNMCLLLWERESVCPRVCLFVWQPKWVYSTVDFNSIKIFSGYLGSQSKDPQLSPSPSFSTPHFFILRLMSFLAYFLANHLDTFLLVQGDQINGTLKTDYFSPVWL